METELKEGEVVVNKADEKVRYTIIKIYRDSSSATCLDARGGQISFPLIALKKYEPPKGPTIRDISNMW